MLIQANFEELPPKPFMLQILDDLSRFYIFLWDKKDKDHEVSVTWKDVKKVFHLGSFRSCLRKLLAKGLLSYEETEVGCSIQLTSWEDVAPSE